MSDNNDLIITQDSTLMEQLPQDLMAQLEQATALQASEASKADTGYTSAFIRIVHPQSQENQPPGYVEVAMDRGDKRFAPVVAGFPVGVIGSPGARDTREPTPMRWPMDWNDTRLKNKWGFNVCGAMGNLEPDPAYYGRVLTHPDFGDIDGVVDPDKTQYVEAALDYNSKELMRIPVTQEIKAGHTCLGCTFGKAWFGLKDENGKAPLVLQQACSPVFSGVIYLVGMAGANLLPNGERKLAQIQASKSAARVFWDKGPKNNDTRYRQDAGIPQAMASVLRAKNIGKMPPYAVMVGGVLYFFPLLAGGIIKLEKDKDGNVKGKSALPFLLDTAEVVRQYTRNVNESDPDVLFHNAIEQVADEMAQITKPTDSAHYKRQIVELLEATTARTSSPHTLGLHQEFLDARKEYELEGKQRMMTPFQGQQQTASSDGESSPAPTGGTTTPEVQSRVVQYEDATKYQDVLSALNDQGDFNFENGNDDESSNGDSPVDTFFAGPVFGDE